LQPKHQISRKTQIDRAGACILVVFSALLGLNQVLIKLVNAGLQPVFQAGLRSLCAFCLVLPLALLARRALSIRDGSLWPGVLAGCFFAVEFLLMFIGLDYTSVARASILFYTMPLWVALGSHFWVGERLTMQRSFGIGVAVIGVVVALTSRSPGGNAQHLTGDLMCLAASFLWAGIALLARTTAFSKSTPEMQLIYQLGVSAPLLLLASLFFGDWLREPSVFIWAIFSFQVVVVVSIGFLVWFWVLSIYPASDMAVYSFLAPVFGVIFGWLILGEPIGMQVLLALALVSAGIVMVNLKPAPKPSLDGRGN